MKLKRFQWNEMWNGGNPPNQWMCELFFALNGVIEKVDGLYYWDLLWFKDDYGYSQGIKTLQGCKRDFRKHIEKELMKFIEVGNEN